MSFMIDHADERTIKAIAICAGSGQWIRCRASNGSVLWGVPSQCKPGVYYLATQTECSCPDARRSGLGGSRIGQAGLHALCKHSLAVRLFEELVKAQQARQPKRRRLHALPLVGGRR